MGDGSKSKNKNKMFKTFKVNKKGKFKTKPKNKTKKITKMQLKGVPIKSKLGGVDHKRKIQKTKEKTINYIKESEILTIYNEDTFVISEKPFSIMENLRQLLRMLYTFIYAFNVFGYVSLLFIIGIFVALLVSRKLFNIWSQFNMESRDLQVTRESYMLSMLKNFRLMKIMRLENIIFYNIEKMNLEEKNQQ